MAGLSRDSACTPLQLYSLELDHIKHENNLVNNRTTWFVQFTAFLLTAYAVVAQLFAKYDVPAAQVGPFHNYVLLGGSVLALVLVAAGLSACFSTEYSVSAAFSTMDSISEHWAAACGEAGLDPLMFPPLLGGGIKSAATKGKRLGILLPYVMTGLWLILAAMPVYLLYRFGHAPVAL